MDLSTKVSQLKEQIEDADIGKPSLAILKTWYELLYDLKGSRGTITKEEFEILGHNTLIYLSAVVDYATECISEIGTKEIRTLIRILHRIASIQEIRDAFIEKVTPRIMDIITTDPSIKLWCGKEILQTYNICLINSDEKIRQEIISKNNMFYLSKLVDLLSICADYEYQETIMESIFRMCSMQQIQKYASALFPEDANLQQTFLQITCEGFDHDIRVFLNKINAKTGRVFSVVIPTVLLDDHKVPSLKDFPDINGLWVDFNLMPKTVSFYCTRDCIKKSSNDREKHIWELITLAPEIVSSVKAKINGDVLEIYFNLTGHADSKLNKLNTVTFIIEYSETAKILHRKVLPKIFEEEIMGSEGSLPSQEEADKRREAGPSKELINLSYRSLDVCIWSSKMSMKSIVSSTSSLKSLCDILVKRSPINKFPFRCGVSPADKKILNEETEIECPSASNGSLKEMKSLNDEESVLEDDDWHSLNNSNPVAPNSNNVNCKLSSYVGESNEYFTAESIPTQLAFKITQKTLNLQTSQSVRQEFDSQVAKEGEFPGGNDAELFIPDSPKKNDPIPLPQIATIGKSEQPEENTESQPESIVFTLESKKNAETIALEEDMEKMNSLIAHPQNYYEDISPNKQEEAAVSVISTDMTFESSIKKLYFQKKLCVKIKEDEQMLVERYMNKRPEMVESTDYSSDSSEEYSMNRKQVKIHTKRKKPKQPTVEITTALIHFEEPKMSKDEDNTDNIERKEKAAKIEIEEKKRANANRAINMEKIETNELKGEKVKEDGIAEIQDTIREKITAINMEEEKFDDSGGKAKKMQGDDIRRPMKKRKVRKQRIIEESNTASLEKVHLQNVVEFGVKDVELIETVEGSQKVLKAEVVPSPEVQLIVELNKMEIEKKATTNVTGKSGKKKRQLRLRKQMRIISDSSDEETVEAEPSIAPKGNTEKMKGTIEIQEEIITSTACFVKEISDTENCEHNLEKNEMMEDATTLEQKPETKLKIGKQKETAGKKEKSKKSLTKLKPKNKKVDNNESKSKITTRQQARKSKVDEEQVPPVSDEKAEDTKTIKGDEIIRDKNEREAGKLEDLMMKSNELVEDKPEMEMKFSDEKIPVDDNKTNKTPKVMEIKEVVEITSHSERDSNFEVLTDITVYSECVEKTNENSVLLSPALNEHLTETVRNAVKKLRSTNDNTQKTHKFLTDDMNSNLNDVESQKITSPEKHITINDIEVNEKANKSAAKSDGEIIDLETTTDERDLRNATSETNTTIYSKGAVRKKRRLYNPDEPTYIDLSTIASETVVTINTTKQAQIGRDECKLPTSKNVTQDEVVTSSNRANETLKKIAHVITEKRAKRHMKLKEKPGRDFPKESHKVKLGKVQKRHFTLNFDKMLNSWLDYVANGKRKVETDMALSVIKKRKGKRDKTRTQKENKRNSDLSLEPLELDNTKTEVVKKTRSKHKIVPFKNTVKEKGAKIELSKQKTKQIEAETIKNSVFKNENKKIKVLSNIVIKRKCNIMETGGTSSKQIKLLSGVTEQYLEGVKQPVMKRISPRNMPRTMALSPKLQNNQEDESESESEASSNFDQTINQIEELVQTTLLKIEESRTNKNVSKKRELLKVMKNQLKFYKS